MNDRLASASRRGGWEFSQAVADGFDRHVANSVAGYEPIQDVVSRVSDWFAPDYSTVVDIGCSTGTTLQRVQERNPGRAFHLIGYDNAPAMIAAARAKLDPPLNPGSTLNLYPRDVTTGLSHTGADLTLAIFTIQFLAEDQRVPVLRSLRTASKPGAVLLLAEKSIPSDSRWALVTAEASWEDKRIAGISTDEIVAKAESLRGVLRPQLETRLLAEAVEAGWSAPQILWAQWQWRLIGFINPDRKEGK